MLTIFIMGILAGWLLEWVFYTFYWKNRKVSDDEVVSSQANVKPAVEKTSTTEPVETPAAETKPEAPVEPKQAAAKADPVEKMPAKDVSTETPAEPKEPVEVKTAPVDEPVAQEQAATKETTEVEAVEPAAAKEAMPTKEVVEVPPEVVEDKAEPAPAQVELPVEAVEETPEKAPELATTEPDDLTKLAGIGPKVAQKLNSMGISTYDDLANTDLDELLTNLGLAGIRINKAASQTWTKQALLAAKQDWQGIEAIKAQLKK